MADNHLDNRRRVRQRQDNTALHFARLDGSNTSATVRLDIVASSLTVQVDNGMDVDVQGSLNGRDFFAIASNVTDQNTYNTHLVKVVRLTRNSGDGQVTVAGV